VSGRNECNVLVDGDDTILNLSNRVKKNRRFSHSINLLLNHLTSSRLDDVGLQLWNGCFLLADFVIYSRNSFKDVVILELGTGAGLIAVIFKYVVNNHLGVLYTDYKDKIVNLAAENVERNSHLLLQSFLPLLGSLDSNSQDTRSCTASRVVGRILDWSSDFNPRSKRSTMDSKMSESRWTMEDCHLLESNRTVFLAADVLYDDVLTVHFFKKIAEMMKQGDEYLILTLEKRVNFSVHLLREVAT
jgi:predicted nicotinamide N-methyase